MKKFLSVTIICTLCLLMCSCSVTPQINLLRAPFRCELSWSFDSMDFSASALLTQSSFSLTLNSPPELRGLSVERRSGELGLYIDRLPAGTPPRFFSYISELLLSDSPFEYLCRSERFGTSAVCYKRGDAFWYFSSEDGRPLGFEDGTVTFRLVWIESLKTGRKYNENTFFNR